MVIDLALLPEITLVRFGKLPSGIEYGILIAEHEVHVKEPLSFYALTGFSARVEIGSHFTG